MRLENKIKTLETVISATSEFVSRMGPKPARDFQHLTMNFPVYHLNNSTTAMASHPKASFPYDDSLMLADTMVEKLSGVYLIRLEFVKRRVVSFRDKQASVLTAVESQMQN